MTPPPLFLFPLLALAFEPALFQPAFLFLAALTAPFQAALLLLDLLAAALETLFRVAGLLTPPFEALLLIADLLVPALLLALFGAAFLLAPVRGLGRRRVGHGESRQQQWQQPGEIDALHALPPAVRESVYPKLRGPAGVPAERYGAGRRSPRSGAAGAPRFPLSPTDGSRTVFAREFRAKSRAESLVRTLRRQGFSGETKRPGRD